MPNSRFDRHFITPHSTGDYRQAIADTVDSLVAHYGCRDAVYSGATARDLAHSFDAVEICPEQGLGLPTVLDEVGLSLLDHSLVVSNPTCMAHLHCPPLIPALAAEVLISATNQSMDSWDQATSATYLEQRVVDWLCRLYGYGERGDGIFTSGGTQSNLMGVLLARDAYARDRLGWDIQTKGLPPEASRFRILASAISHFSVKQSASLLGLGHDAVVPVETDDQHRMLPQALQRRLAELEAGGLLPIAIVATAGTTDFGSIDPLSEITEMAATAKLWLHVDAAYGGALALSTAHAGRLAGIERADSLTIDFHKLFYQPISCGAFLVRDRDHFRLIQLNADYLNPEENEAEGILDLVGKSIQTTRRFDGLKLYMTLRALGREAMAAMVEATLDLATAVAGLLRQHHHFELANQPALNAPALNAVVFRYRRAGLADADCDRLNARLRTEMLTRGRALVAQTRYRGRVFLKMTLLNPRTSVADIEAVLDEMAVIAERMQP